MAAGHSISSHAVAAAAPPTEGQPQFLTTEEAGRFLRLSPRTLEKQRVLGGGPRFRKFGARVVYAVQDLRAWADSRAYGMTSDPGYVQRDSVR
ncbi:helix-turn-helix transcriptional regulator [Variovorax sp. LARHSF232]